MIRNYINMISNYSNLILQEGANSWNDIDFSKKEPDIIKDYLLSPQKGIDYLNHNISKKITSETSYELKFASIYSHQKPRITRTTLSKNKCNGDTDSCELGDLMTVFIFLDKNKKIVYASAKIMQAKKEDILDSKSQECLYESDMDFEMPYNIVTKSTHTTSKIRLLPDYSENRHTALSYLILNNGFPYNKEIPSNSNLKYGWNYYLKLIMELKTGKSFFPPTDHNENSWNCIINDLLNIGSGIVSSSIKRGNGLDFIINAFNYYYYYAEYKMENDEPDIPKMIILCRDTKREMNQ